jgi:hypothetical protein
VWRTEAADDIHDPEDAILGLVVPSFFTQRLEGRIDLAARGSLIPILSER